MGIFERIIGSNIGDLFQKIVGTFKLSPDVAAQLQDKVQERAADLEKLQLDLEKNAQDVMAREVEAASANIRAEAATGDKYTQRSRPTFLYLCYFVFLYAYVAVPSYTLHTVGKAMVLELPSQLLWLFGAGYLGYSTFREVGKLMSLPGNSVLKLPGVELSNDGGGKDNA